MNPEKLGKADRVLFREYFKRPNRMCVLFILSRNSMCGYEIRKEHERITGERMTCASIYPEVMRMKREGMVECVEDTTSGRKRKIYHITPLGVDTALRIRTLMDLISLMK